MSGAMKPFALGEVLDRTIQIYRKNFLLFAGTAFLPTLVLVLMGVGIVTTSMMLSHAGTAASAAGILILIFLLLLFLPLMLGATALANGALTLAAVGLHEGERLTIRAALGGAWRRGWRFLGTQFLAWLFEFILPGALVFGALLLFGVVSAMLAALGAGVASALVALALIFLVLVLLVYLVLAVIRLSLAFAAAVKEGLGPWRAVKRSYDLARGGMGRIFLFGLLVYALTAAVTMVIIFLALIPLIIVAMMMDKSGSAAQQQGMMTAFLVFYYGGTFLAQVLVKPVYSIGLTVFYFDQRVRKEGYDIERLMEQAGLVAQGEAKTAAAESTTWFDQVQAVAERRSNEEGGGA